MRIIQLLRNRPNSRRAGEKLINRRLGFERVRLFAAPLSSPQDLRHGWKAVPFQNSDGVHDFNDVDSFIAKVDHQISQTESLSGRYGFASSQQTFPLGGLGLGAGSRLPQFVQNSPTRVQLVSVSLLSALSSSKINEVRFGYSRYRTSFTSKDQIDPTSALGIDFGTGKLGLPEIDFGRCLR